MTKHFEMAYQDSAAAFTMLFYSRISLAAACGKCSLTILHELVRVIAPDLRGHGFSPVEPPYSIA